MRLKKNRLSRRRVKKYRKNKKIKSRKKIKGGSRDEEKEKEKLQSVIECLKKKKKFRNKEKFISNLEEGCYGFNSEHCKDYNSTLAHIIAANKYCRHLYTVMEELKK